ncbi:hypothetical protein, partial [Rhizobium leguminosarum]|uniref:hypothetical protein n=1 Tax=Rhizobium leguminosarum TaxID=384 RepID=UPI001A8FC520
MKGCFAIFAEYINIIIWSNPKILRLAVGLARVIFPAMAFAIVPASATATADEMGRKASAVAVSCCLNPKLRMKGEGRHSYAFLAKKPLDLV